MHFQRNESVDMDNKSIALIAGIVFISTLWEDVHCGESTECVNKLTKHGTTSVQCSNLPDMRTIPRDLPNQIENLVLDRLALNSGEISAQVFDNYDKLKRLELYNIRGKNKPIEFDQDAFSKLSQLLELRMDNVSYHPSTNPDYNWPKNLRILQAVRIGLTNLSNTLRLVNLKDLDVADNDLLDFPLLNVTAPLETITLDNNPITRIDVKLIAPYCHLWMFKMKQNKDSEFLKLDNKCHCFRLYNWMKKFEIDTFFTCGVYTEGAAGMQIGYTKCPNATNFNAEELKLRQDCESTRPGGITITEFILYAICFSLLFPIGYFLNEYVVNRFRRSGGESEVADTDAARPISFCDGELGLEEECYEADLEEE